jgi:hypothetical protein
MRLEPSAQRLDLTIRQQVNGAAALQIDEQRAVALTSTEGEVIYTDDARCSRPFL